MPPPHMHTKRPGVLPLTAAGYALNTFSTAHPNGSVSSSQQLPQAGCSPTLVATTAPLPSCAGSSNTSPLFPQQCHRSVQASATGAHSGPSLQERLCHTQAAQPWPGWQLTAFWAAMLTRKHAPLPCAASGSCCCMCQHSTRVLGHKFGRQAAASHDQEQEHAGRRHMHTQLKT